MSAMHALQPHVDAICRKRKEKERRKKKGKNLCHLRFVSISSRPMLSPKIAGSDIGACSLRTMPPSAQLSEKGSPSVSFACAQ